MWDDSVPGDMYSRIDWKRAESYRFEYERYEDVNMVRYFITINSMFFLLLNKNMI